MVSLIVAAVTAVSLISSPVAYLPNTNVLKADVGIYVNGVKVTPERQPVSINGRVLVPARTTLNGLNATVDWSPSTNTVKIEKSNTEVKMKIGELNYTVNNKAKQMDTYPILIDGTVMVPVRYIADALDTSVNWDNLYKAVIIGTKPAKMEKKYVVVIDPGHGGREVGAVHGGIREKDLNLQISKKLEALLKANGITTYMTRTDDSMVGLYERSGLANKVNADLLVSVHNNAGSSKTTGSMSLYYPGSGKTKGNLSAQEFASIVQKHLTGELSSRNLGIISRPNLAILRTSNMPAVLAEVGYMTNGAELAKLKSNSYQQKVAEALKNSVIEALKEIQ